MEKKLNRLIKAILNKVNPKRLFWILGRHAFLVILIFILLEVFFAGFISYKYVFLAERSNPQISSSYFQFKNDIYQGILLEWQERSQRLQESLQKEYINPFL